MVIAVELLGIRSLSFAVGFYLSIATTLAIFTGGVVRWLTERRAHKAGEKVEESEVSPGSLYASGLIAAGGIVGLLGIALNLIETQMRDAGNTASADAFRHWLSFGSWADTLGNVHYRIAADARRRRARERGRQRHRGRRFRRARGDAPSLRPEAAGDEIAPQKNEEPRRVCPPSGVGKLLGFARTNRLAGASSRRGTDPAPVGGYPVEVPVDLRSA